MKRTSIFPRLNFSLLSAFLALTAILMVPLARGQMDNYPKDIVHRVVFAEDGKFGGWPANNGVWIWNNNEILVGFTQGEYTLGKDSHNIEGRSISMLARSMDGGNTWTDFDPENYVNDLTIKRHLVRPINFTSPGFALRVFASGYRESDDTEGGFFYSEDRGHTWNGPFYLGDIARHEAFEGRQLTPRTDYIVLGESECLVFISARQRLAPGLPDLNDKTACIRTTDGGRTFEFLSWVVPPSDPYRAVMPQTVLLPDGGLVSVLRRRVVEDSSIAWLDAYGSSDGGKSWKFLSKVADAGIANGNPPSLVRLFDGRLLCVYGNRSDRKVYGRYSSDDGKSWSKPIVVREGYYSGSDDQDFGYCRLVQRTDGRVVAMYYWASREHPQQHIEASIWTP